MLYELAHILKEKCGFLWDTVEWGNAALFGMIHQGVLKDVPTILKKVSNDTFSIRLTEKNDAPKLAKFFEEQPEGAFTFFKPHDFDEKSILKVLKNKAFMTFVVESGDSIVGYFFLRCFVNGKCFRGKIVDKSWQGRGIAKLMGVAMTKVAQHLNLRMFGSISPENYASMASAKASNDIKVHKTLDNGYYYIEFLPKKVDSHVIGGGKKRVVRLQPLFVSNVIEERRAA